MYSVLEGGGEHVAPQHVQVKTVSSVKGGSLPEQVEVMNKTNVVCCAGRLEPGVEVKNPAKTTSATTKCGEWARDNNRLSTVVKEFKKVNKMSFCQFRLPAVLSEPQ